MWMLLTDLGWAIQILGEYDSRAACEAASAGLRFLTTVCVAAGVEA